MIPKNNDLRIEVTTKCNYNCIICPREKLTREKDTMSFDLFKIIFDKIINETDQYDTLTFPGMGEPLLDETLNKKIEYAKKCIPELTVLMLTNGSMLTPQKFKEFEDLGVNSIRVSIYGYGKESYLKVHGIKNYEIYENLKKNILAISEQKSSTQLLLTYNIVEGVNDADLKEWISFWESKVDLLEVWKPHNWVDAREYRDVAEEKLITCGRPFNGPLQVQVDGTVNMCCFDFDGKLTIGDLKKESLGEIFTSRLFNKIKECHTTGNYTESGLICAHCDQRNKNKSGVMVYNSKYDVNERVKQISTTYKSMHK
ncbi:radical SAM/SPASM domain-containing protein [bacterium]